MNEVWGSLSVQTTTTTIIVTIITTTTILTVTIITTTTTIYIAVIQLLKTQCETSITLGDMQSSWVSEVTTVHGNSNENSRKCPEVVAYEVHCNALGIEKPAAGRYCMRLRKGRNKK